MPSLRNIIALVLILISQLQSIAHARDDEFLVAAFLLNFARLTEWPDDMLRNRYRFNMCIVSDTAKERSFRSLAGEKVHNLPVGIDILPDLTSIGECNLLYMQKELPDQWQAIRQQTRDFRVLTISSFGHPDADHFAINLVRIGQRVRYEVNLPVAKEHSLSLSSKLIRYAIKVREVAE